MTDPPDSSARGTRPSSYIRRACMNCRQRKIRCDGERPICRRCRVQPPRSLTPCKYSHAPVSPQEVSPQEEIADMQSESDELQSSGGIILSEPYPTFHYEGSSLDVSDNPMHPFGTSSPIWGTPSPIEELPELTGALMDVFLGHFAGHQFFFLDPPQFRHSALLPLPFGHPDLLPRGLLNCVSLWATRVSMNPFADSIYSEEELLARAVYHLARDVAAIEGAPQQQHILHLMQAEVLLSLYYLDSGRLLQGNYRRACATSLAFTAGLHQLGTASQPLVPSTTPVNAVRRKELVAGFWSVVILNNYWVAGSGVPSSIPCDTPISTPWPTDEDYTSLPNIPSSGPPPGENDVFGHSPLTLLAKASILLERTIAFTARNSGLPHPPEFSTIENRLESFRGHLPPDATVPTDQVSLVTHVLVNAAILRLHAPHSTTYVAARSKCLTAANCIAARLAGVRVAEWEPADPILGPLLAAVADILIANLPSASPAADLQTTLSAMHSLARRSPLIQHHLATTQQKYTSAQQNLGLIVPL